MVDADKVTWLHIYSIPCHAWSSNFFKFITKSVASYMCCDDVTRDQIKMDVAKVIVRTKCSMVLNDIINVKINEVLFRLKIVEDSHDSLRINILVRSESDSDSLGSDSELGG